MNPTNSAQPTHNNSSPKNPFMSDPEAALRCAQFFMVLGQQCYELSISQKAQKEHYKGMDPPRTKQIIKERMKQYGVAPLQKPKHKQSSNESEEEHNQREDSGEVKEKLKKLITQKSQLRREKQKEKKKKMKKQNKNKAKENGIKRPIPAYIFYYKAQQKIFAEMYPGMKINDLTKLIAEKWNQITDEEKGPYFNQALEARANYENQKNKLMQARKETPEQERQMGQDSGSPEDKQFSEEGSEQSSSENEELGKNEMIENGNSEALKQE